MMGSFHSTKKTPVFTVKPSDENLFCVVIGLLHCIQPGENVVSSYTRVNADTESVRDNRGKHRYN